MSKHTPQWRLDIAMMVEALEAAKKELFDVHFQGDVDADVLRAVELAIKLGKQYAHK